MDHIRNSAAKGLKAKKARSKFYGCFPTAQHLAQMLAANLTDGEHSQEEAKTARCRQKGLAVLRGLGGTATNTHLKYNYQTYYEYTLSHYPKKEVFVIRTEHLWDDMSRLDRLLGGSGQFDQSGHKFDHGSEKFAIKSKLSPDEKKIFCQILSPEIAIYKDLILRASNLEEWEKDESLNQLKEDCWENRTI
jgi:hypothetical protein